MHRLGIYVLTLIILLPLARSCESDQDKNKIREDYRNIIQIQLKQVENIIEQLNSTCTVRNVSMSKEPKNTKSLLEKICNINENLDRIGGKSKIVNGELKNALNKLVEEINDSLTCWNCEKRQKRTKKTTNQKRKWKLCRVKDILTNLQRHFEQYNVYQSLDEERGKTSEQTGI